MRAGQPPPVSDVGAPGATKTSRLGAEDDEGVLHLPEDAQTASHPPKDPPVRPRRAVNLAVCPAAGLFVGWGLALLRYPARRTIRGLDDVEEQLKLPVLGVIPKKNP